MVRPAKPVNAAVGSIRRFHRRGTPNTGDATDRVKGCKTAAVIDLKKHGVLWEDIQDILVSRSRKLEKRSPLEKVKSRLVAAGKLRD